MDMTRVLLDYEIQLDSKLRQGIESDARDFLRAEYAKVQVMDRFAAQIGENLTIGVAGAQVWSGVLESIGSGWVQIKTSTESVLIPQSAVMWWEGGSRFSYQDSGEVKRKLTLGYALRALASARFPVRIFHSSDTATTEGTVEKVGLDFIEVAVHGLEGNYRSKKILGYRTLPISQIGAVCSLS